MIYNKGFCYFIIDKNNLIINQPSIYKTYDEARNYRYELFGDKDNDYVIKEMRIKDIIQILNENFKE